MFRKMQSLLHNDKATSYVAVVIVMLCLLMIFSIVLTFAESVICIRQQKDLAKLELDNFTTKNSMLIERNLARSRNNLWRGINKNSYLNNLKVTCGLEDMGGFYCNYNQNGGVKYYISNPTLSFKDENQHLDLVATYTIYVPLVFMGKIITTAHVDIVVTSRLFGDSYNTRTTTTVPATESGG